MKEREISLEEVVSEIYEDVNKENCDSKYIFFLGAGSSKSSGIPLASELAKEWYKELKKQKIKFTKFIESNKLENIDEKNYNFGDIYFKVFETLFPSHYDQQKEIQRITENKTPSLGYYVLSEVMQKAQFNVVITTNFDNLIQDALIYSGNKRALVITHQDLAKFIDRGNTPLIIKIHGDAHIHPFNNSKNTNEIPEELRISIQNLFTNAKVVFLGYKGNDKSISNLLEGCKRIDQVYWFGSSTPLGSKLEKWWENLEVKTYVKVRDFDKVMGLLESTFGFPKPDFQKRADELENSYKKALEEERKEIEDTEDKTATDYFLVGNTYYKQNNYKMAIEQYKRTIEMDSKYEQAYANWGLALHCLARIDDDENLYRESFEKFSNALEINPKSDIVYNNWGSALTSYAKLKNNSEKLYKKAFEKFANAIKINPKYSSAYYNWGTAISDLADINNNQDLFKESFEKFASAIEINPQYTAVYYNWGKALCTLAKHKNNDETLYEESYNKLKRAMDLGASPYNLACLYALRKDKVNALKYLEISLDNERIKSSFVLEDEDWSSFKKDKEFLKIIEKYK